MLLLLELESKVFLSLHDPRLTILSDRKLLIDDAYIEDHSYSFSTSEQIDTRIELSPITVYFENDMERFGYTRLFNIAGIKIGTINNSAWKLYR